MSLDELYHDDPVDYAPGNSRRSSSLFALILAILGAGFFIQTTLASNISLNSGRVEFGQGVLKTVACSGSQSLTITPQSSFVNVAAGGSYMFSGFKVDNIPVGCRGQAFTFAAYDNIAGSAPQAIFNTSRTRVVIHMKSDDTFEIGAGRTGLSLTGNSTSSFTVTFTNPVASTVNIFNLTIESAAPTALVPAGINWTEQASAGSRTWYSIASSSDGSKLVAGTYDGYIYTSTNSGASWVERTSAGTGAGYSVTSSSDGTKLASVAFPGYIYTSTDSGVNWTQRTFAGYRYWISIASSSDGNKLVAAANTGYIYTSTDSGATWTTQGAASDIRAWQPVASSSDGSKLVAGVSGGYIYTSSDSGASWTEQVSSGSRSWSSMASSSDGSKLAATADGYIYISTDSGASWNQQVSTGARSWTSVTSSSDGNKLAAVDLNGYIYTSTNSGASWIAQIGSGVRPWAGIASNSDGSKLAAVTIGGLIYTSSGSD